MKGRDGGWEWGIWREGCRVRKGRCVGTVEDGVEGRYEGRGNKWSPIWGGMIKEDKEEGSRGENGVKIEHSISRCRE